MERNVFYSIIQDSAASSQLPIVLYNKYRNCNFELIVQGVFIVFVAREYRNFLGGPWVLQIAHEEGIWGMVRLWPEKVGTSKWKAEKSTSSVVFLPASLNPTPHFLVIKNKCWNSFPFKRDFRIPNQLEPLGILAIMSSFLSHVLQWEPGAVALGWLVIMPNVLSEAIEYKLTIAC